MERTTKLGDLAKGAEFTWGDLVKIHRIGEYTVVEHHPWKVDGVRVLTGQPNNATSEFSCYIENKSLSRSTNSLDSALAICIAYKHDGANSQAARYFIKMISQKGE